jgi:hypothetical protein
MCILLEYPSIEDYPVYEPSENCGSQITMTAPPVFMTVPKSEFNGTYGQYMQVLPNNSPLMQ